MQPTTNSRVVLTVSLPANAASTLTKQINSGKVAALGGKTVSSATLTPATTTAPNVRHGTWGMAHNAMHVFTCCIRLRQRSAAKRSKEKLCRTTGLSVGELSYVQACWCICVHMCMYASAYRSMPMCMYASAHRSMPVSAHPSICSRQNCSPACMACLYALYLRMFVAQHRITRQRCSCSALSLLQPQYSMDRS